MRYCRDGNLWVWPPLLPSRRRAPCVGRRQLAPPGLSLDGNGGKTIAIADCGAGMEAEFVRTRLFQPFASTKKGGFGVGAFEAKSLVSAMDGRLTVESKPGEGSLFTITLPAAEAAREAKRKRA
jgi:hypothetical protein